LIYASTSLIIEFIARRTFVAVVIQNAIITSFDQTGYIGSRKNAISLDQNIILRTNLTSLIQIRAEKAVRQRRIILSALVNCPKKNSETLLALSACIIIDAIYAVVNLAHIGGLSNVDNASPTNIDKPSLTISTTK
jgi:hypothetical protein